MAGSKQKTLITVSQIIIHGALAVGAAISSLVSQAWAATVLLIGIYKIVRNKNRNHEAILWSSYMCGLEVVLRGTGGSLVWELGKYSVILFLLLGYMYRKKAKTSIGWILCCVLLLIPGILITLTWSQRISQDISFNISGIICLLVSSLYFTKISISNSSLNQLVKYFLLPAIALAVVLFYKTPDLSEINFSSKANFATSGGFGPNQVATILGLGWVLIIVWVNKKVQITGRKILTYSLFAFIVFRSLLTFSRGGNIAAILAYFAFIFTYLKAKESTVISFGYYRNVVAVSVLSVILIAAINQITGGMFANRYLGLNSEGERKVDVTAGRVDLLEEEYALFTESPFGVGAGGSMHFRTIKFGNPLASHNEFGRLLSEHGVLGIIIILFLVYKPIKYYRRNTDVDAKALCALFFMISMLTAAHSAFRLAMPAFFYGFSFLKISYENNTLYRK